MPKITSSLTPSADQALWILDVYGFVVGSLLVTFGNIGDRYGRLRILRIGSIIFGIGSIGAAVSPNSEMLIVCRTVMGLGGATLLPSGLAIVSNLFPDPKQRARAIGIFAAAFAGGFAIGPIIGGVLLTYFHWGSVFLINIPVVAVFIVFSGKLLEEVTDGNQNRIDIASLILSIAGIFLFTYSIKIAAAYGASVEQFALGLFGLLAIFIFISRQKKLSYPLLDVALFKDRIFSIAIFTGLLSLVVWSASGYLIGIYLQSVLGLSVFTTALLALPGACVLILTCVFTGKLVDYLGRKNALVATHVLIGIGAFLLLFTDRQTGIGLYLVSTIISGVGYGLSFSLVAEIAISAAPKERAGAAASIAETSNEIGNAFGISILGSVAAFYFRIDGPGVAGTLNETLQYPNLQIDALNQAQQAFVSGMHVALGIAGVVSLLVGVLAIFWLPKTLPE